jgi:hypothetical protein
VTRTALLATVLALATTLALILLPLAARRRDTAARRLLKLGAVSSQWLLSHRQEDL